MNAKLRGLAATLTFLGVSCGGPSDAPTSGAASSTAPAGASNIAPAAALSAAAVDSAVSKAPLSADAVLRDVFEFLKKQSAFRVDITHSFRVQGSDAEQILSEHTLLAQRPNRLAMRHKAGEQGMTLVSDGTKLLTYLVEDGHFSESPAPATLAEFLKLPGLAQAAHGPHGFFALNLLALDPMRQILADDAKAVNVEQLELDGRAAYRVNLRAEDFIWELWIAAQNPPVVMRVAATQEVDAEEPPQGDSKKKETVTIAESFRNWQFGLEPSATEFAFQPPPNAKKVPDLWSAPEPQRPALFGQPAPDIEMAHLDGTPFSLKSHRGKDVVVLDFWALWCGPCIKELPLLNEIDAAYRNKGVAFRAINLGDDADAIRTFLKKSNLDIRVVPDTKEQTAKAYGIDGIPLLLVIDKQGIIQAVHIGYSADIKTTLSAELDALLAGKSLFESKASTP
jgi:peroxiredoxin